MWYFSHKKAQLQRFIYTLIAEKKVMKGVLCSTDFNMNIPGLKDVLIIIIEETESKITIPLELER